MRFSVLGSIEVVDERGEDVPLRWRKRRLVLALLLAAPNQVVSVDRLEHAAWPGGPPRSARSNLQSYLAALRTLLGNDRIVWRAPGYLLVIRPGELDSRMFADSVAEARSSWARGELGDAVERYEDALALWRGEPYAEFTDVPLLRAEAARLAEIRLSAIEERCDAALGIGRHREQVGELSALVAEHPLRERLRYLLMLALYRSGRAAEALAHYRDGRRLLVDELGIEPGIDLRDLERAILIQDRALELPCRDAAFSA